jgi:hypothetical protein
LMLTGASRSRTASIESSRLCDAAGLSAWFFASLGSSSPPLRPLFFARARFLLSSRAFLLSTEELAAGVDPSTAAEPAVSLVPGGGSVGGALVTGTAGCGCLKTGSEGANATFSVLIAVFTAFSSGSHGASKSSACSKADSGSSAK